MVQLREESRRTLSPDQLGSYIKVSKPSVWMTLGIIAALLIAGVVWFFAGSVNENAMGEAVVDSGSATVYVPLSSSSSIQAGDVAVLSKDGDEVEGTVTAIAEVPVAKATVLQECGLQELSTFAHDTWGVAVSIETQAAPGIYDARIVTATHRPIRLLLGLD